MRRFIPTYRVLTAALALLLLLGANLRNVAQPNSQLIELYNIEGIGGDLGNLWWSQDSIRFAFVAPESRLSGSYNWYLYDVATSTVTISDTWPLRPQFSAQELQDYDLSQDDIQYVSPDQTWFSYNENENSQDIWEPEHIVLVNRQSGEVVETTVNPLRDDVATSPHAGTDHFRVLWSEDNSAVLVKTTGILVDASVFYYVTGYTDSPPNLSVYPLDELVFDNEQYFAINAYDISSDGRAILIATAPTLGGFVRFVVMDVEASTVLYSISADLPGIENVLDVMFMPGNEQKLLAFMDQGVVEVNLSSATVQVLWADTTSFDFQRAEFSPNGQWIGLATDEAVFVLNLAQNLPP
jgi:hypothetical protein